MYGKQVSLRKWRIYKTHRKLLSLWFGTLIAPNYSQTILSLLFAFRAGKYAYLHFPIQKFSWPVPAFQGNHSTLKSSDNYAITVLGCLRVLRIIGNVHAVAFIRNTPKNTRSSLPGQPRGQPSMTDRVRSRFRRPFSRVHYYFWRIVKPLPRRLGSSSRQCTATRDDYATWRHFYCRE